MYLRVGREEPAPWEEVANRFSGSLISRTTTDSQGLLGWGRDSRTSGIPKETYGVKVIRRTCQENTRERRTVVRVASGLSH